MMRRFSIVREGVQFIAFAVMNVSVLLARPHVAIPVYPYFSLEIDA
jgi:hypothetical protein